MLLSLIIPLYNEKEVLPDFHVRAKGVLDAVGMDVEFVYVNDGSTDESIEVLQSLREQDDRIAIVNLSRNFGKEIALSAGLDHSQGDLVVVIDADLQDPPELIPEFIKGWREGYDVVYAKRISRRGESFLKKVTASAFYWTIRRVTNIDIPQSTGDFRLLTRRAVDALNALRERHRFMKGLFAWIGFPHKAVEYERDPRFAGTTKWNYWKLWNLALEGITSFTIAPLKIASYVGFVTSLGAFVYGVWIFIKTVVLGVQLPGYASLMTVVLFLGGIQLLTLGIIGEYVGRIFNETKSRPLYLIEEYQSASAYQPNKIKPATILSDEILQNTD